MSVIFRMVPISTRALSPNNGLSFGWRMLLYTTCVSTRARRLLTAACEPAPLTLVSAFSTFDLALDRFADEGGPLLAIGKDSSDPLERPRCEFRPNSLRPSFLASHAWLNSDI
jgi:hypothetical protein